MSRRCSVFVAALFLASCKGLVVPVLLPSRSLGPSTALRQQQPKTDSAGLVFGDDLRSNLASAFSSLDVTDQYDAVLTGLCAKILDDDEAAAAMATANGDEGAADMPTAISVLEDPMNLLDEMNKRRVKASPRSLMALTDATVKTEDPTTVAKVLSLSRKNGGVKQYGLSQSKLTALPSSPSGRVRCPDGRTRSRQQRLDQLADVPTDERGLEVASALAVLSVSGFCVLTNWMGMDDISPYTTALLSTIIGVGVVDNFYDVISFAAKLAKDKVEIPIPDKGSLPLDLGSGKVTGTVVRGLTRITSPETERECECEAAAFFTAYTLGLPCFAFRPNALEGAVLVAESLKSTKDNKSVGLDPLLSDMGLMKMLVWLMAPVAMESARHPQLIVSDPREGHGLLVRLQDKADLLVSEKGEPIDLWWTNKDGEEQDMLKWAYTEADLMLRNNKDVVQELSERLASGAATVGDLVAVVEGW